MFALKGKKKLAESQTHEVWYSLFVFYSRAEETSVMTRIRGDQMAPRIDHNNTVPLIKMTLSRTAKHIPRAPVQNSQAVVRKGGFILYHGRAGILYSNVILLLFNIFQSCCHLLISTFPLKSVLLLFSWFNDHFHQTVVNRSLEEPLQLTPTHPILHSPNEIMGKRLWNNIGNWKFPTCFYLYVNVRGFLFSSWG